MGTLAYMALEQAEGKTLDHRSDIFSMGIILYKMATGRLPFRGETTAALLASIIKDTPPFVTELNTGLPRDLARIIRRCLLKDPEDRYQTAKDLRNELKELKREVESGEALETVTAPRTRGRRFVVALVATPAALSVLASYLIQRRMHEPIKARFTQLTSRPGEEVFSKRFGRR